MWSMNITVFLKEESPWIYKAGSNYFEYGKNIEQIVL